MNVIFTENCLKISSVDRSLAKVVLTARCVFMSPKEASQYLDSLYTRDGHLEEPTVYLIRRAQT